MSTLQVNTLQNSSGQERFTASAWVNFNGTGTVAIRAAGNVSSITDNGVGDYTVNFTTPMPDVNYSFTGGCTQAAQGTNVFLFGNLLATQLAGSLRINVNQAGVGLIDSTVTSVAIFR